MTDIIELKPKHYRKPFKYLMTPRNKIDTFTANVQSNDNLVVPIVHTEEFTTCVIGENSYNLPDGLIGVNFTHFHAAHHFADKPFVATFNPRMGIAQGKSRIEAVMASGSTIFTLETPIEGMPTVSISFEGKSYVFSLPNAPAYGDYPSYEDLMDASYQDLDAFIRAHSTVHNELYAAWSEESMPLNPMIKSPYSENADSSKIYTSWYFTPHQNVEGLNAAGNWTESSDLSLDDQQQFMGLTKNEDDWIGLSPTSLNVQVNITYLGESTYRLDWTAPVRITYVGAYHCQEPVGDSERRTYEVSNRGFSDYVSKITLTVTAQEDTSTKHINYGLLNGVLSDTYLPNKYPYQMEESELLTEKAVFINSSTLASVSYIDYVAEQLLRRYVNGKKVIECTVPAKWATQVNLHTGSLCKVTTPEHEVLSEIYEVENIEKVYDSTTFEYRLQMIEVPQLQAPSIIRTANTLAIHRRDLNDEGYYLYVGKESDGSDGELFLTYYISPTNLAGIYEFDLSSFTFPIGTDYITVKSFALGYVDSEFSNSIEYVPVSDTLATPSIVSTENYPDLPHVDGFVVIYSATEEEVLEKASYQIYVNGVLKTTIAIKDYMMTDYVGALFNLYDLNLEAGVTYAITARAVCTGYYSSADSSAYSWTPQGITIPTRTVQGNPISIADAIADEAVALSIDIALTQLGSGTPALDNIRKIVGSNTLSLRVNNTTLPITLQVDQDTFAAGTLNILTGYLVVTHLVHNFTGMEPDTSLVGSGSSRYFVYQVGALNYAKSSSASSGTNGWCSHLPLADISSSNTMAGYRVLNSTSANVCRLCFRNTSLTTAAQYRSWMYEQAQAGTPIQGAYALTTQRAYNITPEQVLLLLGSNSIRAQLDSDTAGTLTLTYKAQS